MLKATKICLSGRPGPVWLDVPLEIQWSDIKFDKKYIYKKINQKFSNKNLNNYKRIFKYLSNSKKPLLVLGSGVKGRVGENLVKNL